jgi:DedD protein
MGFFTRKDDEAGSSDATAARARGRRAARRDASVDPLDPLELARKRARRRLIGAVALVLGAVVLLPMVFDSEPKNASDDLSVEIPSQNSSFNPALPVAAGSSAIGSSSATPLPANPAQSALVPGAPLTAAESSAARGAPLQPQVIAPATSNASQPSTSTGATPAQSSGNARAAVPASQASSAKAAEVKPAEVKPAEVKPAEVKNAEAKATAKSAAPGHNDDPRALAALEGKDITPTSSPSDHGTEHFAVQIGAFSNADKVKEVRDRLQAAGLKPYTENLSTAQGQRTRVRVGPFATHEAAEAAREKVKGLGYDGSVVTL